jgi:hypothetical protein|tara:strand:+ start:291 stop:458 length:168 start_codon:yes stop_codon:yes gene_type:complete
MDMVKLEKKWRKACPEEAKGLVNRVLKKRTKHLWDIRRKGAEARKKRREQQATQQ